MQKTSIIPVFILAALILFSTNGCYYDKEYLLYPSSGATCTTISAKFSTDVNTIIQNKCSVSGCHDAASGAGNTVLVTYAQISAKAARINQRCIIDKTMPPGSPLSPAEISVLQCWIASGAPNN